MWFAVVAICVGLSWGVTNALMQQGVSEGKDTVPPRRIAAFIGDHWARLICAKTYLLSQLLNWCTSLVFILSLKAAALHSATPLANAVSVIANAITSSCVLGNEVHCNWLVPGVLFTTIGAALIAC